MNFYTPFFPNNEYNIIDPGLAAELDHLPPPAVGHISPAQGEFLFHFIRLIRPALVVETGFGVGHSAVIVMMAQQSVGIAPRLISVDDCNFEQSATAAKILSTRFAGHMFIKGDSKVVLAGAIDKYLRDHQGATLDLGIVDGGHDAETAASDLSVITSFLKLGGFIWIDDYDRPVPNSGVNIASREYARKWGFCHRYRTVDARGFMLCQRCL